MNASPKPRRSGATSRGTSDNAGRFDARQEQHAGADQVSDGSSTEEPQPTEAVDQRPTREGRRDLDEGRKPTDDPDLLVPHARPGQRLELVRVGAFTAGYVRDFDWVSGLRTGIGADVTAYSFPSTLKPVYGDFPLSVHAFLRLRWGSPHAGAGHAGHAGMKM